MEKDSHISAESQMLLSNAQAGDKTAIYELLQHRGAIYRINGILNATRFVIKSEDVVNIIRSLKDDDVFIDGYTVSDFANAALELLEFEKYEGNEDNVYKLINSKFDFG